MTLSALICRVRGHAWSRYRRISAVAGERTCKCCGKREIAGMRSPGTRKFTYIKEAA